MALLKTRKNHWVNTDRIDHVEVHKHETLLHVHLHIGGAEEDYEGTEAEAILTALGIAYEE